MENIIRVGVNGLHITCPGVLDGEIILHVMPDCRSLYLLMMASSPDIQLLISNFLNLIHKNFPQCILLELVICIYIYIRILLFI